jgi:hypothetical protein
MQHFTKHRAYRGVRKYTALNQATVGLYARPVFPCSTEYLRAVRPSERLMFRDGATVTTSEPTGSWAEMEPTLVIYDPADVIAHPRAEFPEESYDASFHDNPQMWS